MRSSRELLAAHRTRVAALEEQVAAYRESNRLLDAAYVAAVREIADLRVAIANLENALKASEERARNLEEALTRERQATRSAQRRERIAWAVTAGAVGLSILLNRRGTRLPLPF